MVINDSGLSSRKSEVKNLLDIGTGTGRILELMAEDIEIVVSFFQNEFLC